MPILIGLDERPIAPVTLPAVAWMSRPDPELAAAQADAKFDATIAEALKSWRRLRGSASWADWLLVFPALGAIRDRATEISGWPRGGEHNKAKARLLEASGLGEIPASTRSNALACFDHLAEVQAWRDAAPKRQKLHDPQSVWREFNRSRENRPRRAADLGTVFRKLAAMIRAGANALDYVEVLAVEDAEAVALFCAVVCGDARRTVG